MKKKNTVKRSCKVLIRDKLWSVLTALSDITRIWCFLFYKTRTTIFFLYLANTYILLRSKFMIKFGVKKFVASPVASA